MRISMSFWWRGSRMRLEFPAGGKQVLIAASTPLRRPARAALSMLETRRAAYRSPTALPMPLTAAIRALSPGLLCSDDRQLSARRSVERPRSALLYPFRSYPRAPALAPSSERVALRLNRMRYAPALGGPSRNDMMPLTRVHCFPMLSAATWGRRVLVHLEDERCVNCPFVLARSRLRPAFTNPDRRKARSLRLHGAVEDEMVLLFAMRRRRELSAVLADGPPAPAAPVAPAKRRLLGAYRPNTASWRHQLIIVETAGSLSGAER